MSPHFRNVTGLATVEMSHSGTRRGGLAQRRRAQRAGAEPGHHGGEIIRPPARSSKGDLQLASTVAWSSWPVAPFCLDGLDGRRVLSRPAPGRGMSVAMRRPSTRSRVSSFGPSQAFDVALPIEGSDCTTTLSNRSEPRAPLGNTGCASDSPNAVLGDGDHQCTAPQR